MKALPCKISLVLFFHIHQTQHQIKDNTKTGEERTRTLETLQNVIKEVHGCSKNIIHPLDTGGGGGGGGVKWLETHRTNGQSLKEYEY